jgi:hypothetical protein
MPTSSLSSIADEAQEAAKELAPVDLDALSGRALSWDVIPTVDGERHRLSGLRANTHRPDRVAAPFAKPIHVFRIHHMDRYHITRCCAIDYFS